MAQGLRRGVFVAAVMWAGLAASVAHAASPPVNTVAPVISGTVQQGHTLGVSRGTWASTEQLIYGYQWQQCASPAGDCSNIAGATSSTYVPSSGDVDHYLVAVVTATDQQSDSAAAKAAQAGLVKSPAPRNFSSPVISGDAQDGRTLSVVSNGTWSSEGTLTFTYEWRICYLTGSRAGNCNEPPGQDASFVQLSAADVGQQISVEVTAIDHVGASSSYINDADLDGADANRIGPIGPPPAPFDATLPVISGIASDGQTLSLASNGSWSSPDLLHYAYQWVRCDPTGKSCTTAIPAQDTRSYKLTSADIGHEVTIQVTATDQERQSGMPTLATALGPVTSTSAPILAPTRARPGPPAVSARIGSTVSSRGRVSAAVYCPSRQTSCAGTIQLRTAKPVAEPKRGKRRSKRAHKRVLTLGSASFSIAGGGNRTVSIRLSRAAMALMRSAHSVSVIATLSARNPQGETSPTRYRLKLRASQRNHRSRGRVNGPIGARPR